jgi:hypothetical protein
MLWYHYVACFFAGVFLTNAIPHFVHGVSGDKFPTPFAKPPGKGLSSPRINVVWALINIAIGSLLVGAGKISPIPSVSFLIFFAGVAAMSFRLSFALAGKDKDKESLVEKKR